jgi:nitrogen fixation NifU-like protein
MNTETEDQVYKQEILDYIDSPVNFGVIEHADVDEIGRNPICGDEVRITALVDEQVIQKIHFSSEGCAISKAYASMFTELAAGMKVDEFLALTDDDVINKLHIRLTPARIKCALLGYRTLRKALQ